MERLRPITLEQEIPIDICVAAFVVLDLSSNCLDDVGLVEILADPGGLGVAKVFLVLALLADIVYVVSSALERANHSIITIDSTGDTGPHALGVVAALDERLATREGVVHRLTLTLVEHRIVATLTTSHWAVLSILGPRVRQTITNGNALQVDVTVLMRQDLRGEDGNVVTSIRLSSNVEGLLSVLGEVVEEQGQESVDVLAGGDSVVDGVAAVGVASIDRLVDEDDRGIAVPGVFVVLERAVFLDAGGTQFHEESHHGRAAGAAVEP